MSIISLWFGAGLALVYLLQIATERPPEGHALRSATKTGATLGLVVASLAAGAPILITLGLTLGAAGDFCLSRRGQVMFLAGMAAFAAGHLAYASHYFMLFPNDHHAQSLWQLYAGLALLILWRSTEGWLIPHTKDLRWPVRGYAAVICLMGVMAISLPSQATGHGAALLRLGAALFILSDALLAFRLFLTAKPAVQRALSLALWPAYWLGQTLILRGALDYWS